MSEFSFAGKYIIEAEMECRTGLHIGGISEGYEIGGVDNVVVKVPASFEVTLGGESYQIPAECPYVPGSSLKGKLRSLLEWAEGKVKVEKVKAEEVKAETGQAGEEKAIGWKAPVHTCKEADCSVCTIFGSPAEEATVQGPTRLSVLDAYPTKETLDKWEKELGTGIFTELKAENTIDRLTSQANPRQMERVPAGSVFRVTMVYDVYQEDDKKHLKKVFQAMKLLQDSFLGGSGSRGSGRVDFRKFNIVYRPIEYYKGELKEETICDCKNKSLNDILEQFDDLFLRG